MCGKVYAVKAGRKTGIFSTWDETRPLVDGFKGNLHKSFRTVQEAEEYLRQGTPDSDIKHEPRTKLDPRHDTTMPGSADTLHNPSRNDTEDTPQGKRSRPRRGDFGGKRPAKPASGQRK